MADQQGTADSYHRPATIEAALAIAASGRARPLGGATDLYPASGAGPLPGMMLDLTAIPDLAGISAGGAGLRIGATTTWATIARAELPPACQALQEAARQVGGRQVQESATIAGNLCNASPAADGMPPLLALDAEVTLASSRGSRNLPLAAFVTGPRATARAADEIVISLQIPASALAGRSRFLKLGARAHLVISIAMVAVRLDADGAGRIRQAALAVGACGPVAQRLPAAETALVGLPLCDAAGALSSGHVAALRPIDDIRASADYRREAALELLRRALDDLAGGA